MTVLTGISFKYPFKPAAGELGARKSPLDPFSFMHFGDFLDREIGEHEDMHLLEP